MTHALLVAAMVMIRTYNYMQVPADDIARARGTADRTFQQAGISLQWVDCEVTSSIVDRPSSIVDRPSSIGDRWPAEAPSAKAGPSSIVDRPSSIVNRVPAEAWSAKSAQSASGDRQECVKPPREGSDFVLRLVPSPAAENDSARIVAMGTSLINHDSHAGVLMTVDPELVLKIARGSGVDFATLLGRAIAHEIGHLLLGHSQHSRDGLMRAIWSQDEIRGIRTAGWQFSAAEGVQMRQGLAARSRSAN